MQTLDMLEKKEDVLLKEATAELEKAKEFTRAKNKRGAPFLLIGKSVTLVFIHGCIFL